MNNMIITESMLEQYIYTVHIGVAKKLKIEDYEFLLISELDELIKKINPSIFLHMNNFLESYRKWYEVCKKIKKPGNLTENENINLMAAIKNRDNNKQILLESLK